MLKLSWRMNIIWNVSLHHPIIIKSYKTIQYWYIFYRRWRTSLLWLMICWRAQCVRRPMLYTWPKPCMIHLAFSIVVTFVEYVVGTFATKSMMHAREASYLNSFWAALPQPLQYMILVWASLPMKPMKLTHLEREPLLPELKKLLQTIPMESSRVCYRSSSTATLSTPCLTGSSEQLKLKHLLRPRLDLRLLLSPLTLVKQFRLWRRERCQINSTTDQR